MSVYGETKDIGMIGETVVALWASQAGFTPTKFTWDKLGSDYFIQARPTAGERRRVLLDPPPMSCVVQVKAARKSEGHVDIALSNLHALVTTPLPAFVIVVVLDEDMEPCDGRVIHLDRGWVERVTKRIVDLPLAERDQLHKKSMRCNWSRDGTALQKPHYWKSVLSFIEHEAGGDARKYAADKAKWHDDVGYDASPFRVGITLPMMATHEANDTLARFAVGLLDRLPLARMTVTARRFDQEEQIRDIGAANDIHMQLGAEPHVDIVEIAVRSTDGQDEAVLRTKLRVARNVFAFLPDEHNIWRFSADFLDIVVRSPLGEENPRVNFALNLGENQPLADLARAVRAFRILSSGRGCELLVRHAEFDQPFPLHVPPQTVPEFVEGSRYRQAIEDADRLTRVFGIENVTLTSAEDLEYEARRLRVMAMFLGPIEGDLEIRSRLVGDPTGSPVCWPTGESSGARPRVRRDYAERRPLSR